MLACVFRLLPRWTLRAGAILAMALLIAPSASAQRLPPQVETALARARIPTDAVAVLVADVSDGARPRLAHQAEVPVNPASVIKLLTTFAALDLLGPAFTWTTPVYADGPIQDGTLHGNLYLRGQGDPTLTSERLWLLMRRIQGLGIRHITGNIVLDRSAFEPAPHDPAGFDGEPLRPYNAAPDALLVNYRSVVLTFVPDRQSGTAAVHVEPALAGLEAPRSVPLSPAPCGDWRAALQADWSQPSRLRFTGAFPAACSERVWPLAFPDPDSHAARAIAGQWAALGGTLAGRVREGQVPAGLTPAFVLRSPTLAEVVRDINKYSNNVMAQQLFLTLSLQQQGLGSAEGSRALLRQWWATRIGGQGLQVLDNGSGLSRETRVTAAGLARLLQVAWASPVMPELMASLPVAGVDGTLRRRATSTAHLKTGSLRDVNGIAGYVLGASGRRYVLVAMVNHPNAGAARAVLDALTDWTARDR